jgi:hypothetical protein
MERSARFRLGQGAGPKFAAGLRAQSALANCMRDFGRIAQPLRTMSALPRQPQLVPSREARVYDSRVGPGMNALFLLMDSGSTAPTR